MKSSVFCYFKRNTVTVTLNTVVERQDMYLVNFDGLIFQKMLP
jgi:hypothetical protein